MTDAVDRRGPRFCVQTADGVTEYRDTRARAELLAEYLRAEGAEVVIHAPTGPGDLAALRDELTDVITRMRAAACRHYEAGVPVGAIAAALVVPVSDVVAWLRSAGLD